MTQFDMTTAHKVVMHCWDDVFVAEIETIDGMTHYVADADDEAIEAYCQEECVPFRWSFRTPPMGVAFATFAHHQQVKT